MNRGPTFDELIGAEATGAERERLRRTHELLLQAGPPPELTPELAAGPTVGVSSPARRRREVKRRTMVLLAAALAVVAVFAAGYAIGNTRGSRAAPVIHTLSLKGTPAAPDARATLEVLHARDGNWPMTLSVVGLHRLPPHSYYEVYVLRDGKAQPWGLCGTFRVKDSSRVLSVTLNAPYELRPGDSWVVTRQGPSGREPGKTVLRPVSA